MTLASILEVAVGDDDAADGSAISAVLEVTPASELFLLSALSNSGNFGIELVAPTVNKLHMKMQMNSKFSDS